MTVLVLMECITAIGNQCGLSGSLQEPFKYLYWANIESIDTDPNALDETVCVSSCPLALYETACYPNLNYTTCPMAVYDTYPCKIDAWEME